MATKEVRSIQNPDMLGNEEEIVALKEKDVREVMEAYSKSLDGRLMVDKGFSDGMMEGAFNAIWNRPEGFRMWDMPEFCKTKTMTIRTGQRMGDIMDVEEFNMKGKEDCVIKIRVKLDVTRTLKQSIKVSNLDKSIIKIHLKYEKLGIYYCLRGHIGHEIRSCPAYLKTLVAQEEIEGEVE
ncbi:hypothetical protein AHAS_Ahas07G0055800 [Arachis hypogaea]